MENDMRDLAPCFWVINLKDRYIRIRVYLFYRNLHHVNAKIFEEFIFFLVNTQNPAQLFIFKRTLKISLIIRFELLHFKQFKEAHSITAFEFNYIFKLILREIPF